MSVAAKIYPKTNGKCYYCGVHVGENFDIEHVIPWSLGGSDNIENLVPSCKPCNREKATRSIEEWRLAKMAAAMMKAGKAPHFTVHQITWLKSKGFDPYDGAEPYVFWFERRDDGATCG